MEEVERICSRIMILDKGKAIATGTNSELKAMIATGEKSLLNQTMFLLNIWQPSEDCPISFLQSITGHCL